MKTAQQPEVATAADPMRPRLYRVRKTRRETNDTFTMVLDPMAHGNVTPFAPGQFNMVYVHGVGECAISISSDPAEQKTLMHTVRVVGSVTKALYGMKPGDTVGIRGPFGTPWPLDEAVGNDVVFVAGGIGLAPLRPALCHVLAGRERFGRVTLLYGTRTPDDMPYRREVQKWRSDLGMDVHVTVDHADSAWRGNVGVVTTLIKRAPFDLLNSIAMVCGPEVMMHFTVLELLSRGIPQENIYVSMERNMKCGTGFCGHCQLGPVFVCKDGPVFRYDVIKPWMEHREL
ncbi:MAG: FAD/NAD(P)-binding protein [bacterium]